MSRAASPRGARSALYIRLYASEGVVALSPIGDTTSEISAACTSRFCAKRCKGVARGSQKKLPLDAPFAALQRLQRVASSSSR